MLITKGVDSALQVLRTGVFRTYAYLTVSNTTWQISQKSLKQEDKYHVSITERVRGERGWNTVLGCTAWQRCSACLNTLNNQYLLRYNFLHDPERSDISGLIFLLACCTSSHRCHLMRSIPRACPVHRSRCQITPLFFGHCGWLT